MDNGTASRKRKKTERFGDTSENMDDLLDEINQSTTTTTKSNNEDIDVVNLSESTSSNVSNSESIGKITFEENGSQKSLDRHLARLEAKINQMHSLLIQIQRACISSAVSSLNKMNELDRINEIPLETEELLDKFELDLSQESYRQKIVSILHSHTISDFNSEI